jgi:peptide/nickel transport system permease protein
VTALGPILGILYYVAAVLARDYPLVLGLTVVLTVAIVVANLLVDVLHALLDPRIRDAVTAR